MDAANEISADTDDPFGVRGPHLAGLVVSHLIGRGMPRNARLLSPPPTIKISLKCTGSIVSGILHSRSTPVATVGLAVFFIGGVVVCRGRGLCETRMAVARHWHLFLVGCV